MTKTVETYCEAHDHAGHCTEECATLTNMMSGGYSGVPYDPTGCCSHPAPSPETFYVLDEVKRAVVEVTYHPDQCQCDVHPDDWDGGEYEEGRPEPAPRVCYHCGETVFETEDGLYLHADETFDHLARPVPAEHPYPHCDEQPTLDSDYDYMEG